LYEADHAGKTVVEYDWLNVGVSEEYVREWVQVEVRVGGVIVGVCVVNTTGVEVCDVVELWDIVSVEVLVCVRDCVMVSGIERVCVCV
jgi:hypothetical protein